MKSFRYGLFVAAALSSIACLHAPQRSALSVSRLKPSGIYRVGDTVGWTVEGSGPCAYVVKQNNFKVLESGELDLSSGKAAVQCRLREPGMVFMTLTEPGQKPRDFGAAVEPLKIDSSTPRPADFDTFWAHKLSELRAIPENPVWTPKESGDAAIEYGVLKMDHVNGTHVYGQLAKPSKPGKYPAMLILLWASPPYPLERSWVAGHAKEGWISLNIEPHDVLPTEPPAYYQSLPDELKNYTAIRQGDLERNYFVEMYLRGVRALDYLAKRPDWDGKTLLVMGTSMGGQQSLAVSGLHPKVTHMIVNVPAGCDLNASLHERQLGYPFFNDKDPKAMEVSRYIDCANFAPNIKATSLVGLGFVDTACPPAGIFAAFNRIKGPKEVVPMVDSPHNHLATPEQQRPINERTAAWLAALGKGEPAPVRAPIDK